MPKLWTDTIEAHRRTVHDAILDAAAALVAERGLRGVTMAQIAERTGIGRATLYKYFPDVDTMLRMWHRRQIEAHLAELTALRDHAGTTSERLQRVLEGYAAIQHSRGSHEEPAASGAAGVVALLHQDERLAHAQRHLADFVRDVIADAADAGAIREDLAPAELASYCLHALSAARGAASKAAVRRLVTATLDGLHFAAQP